MRDGELNLSTVLQDNNINKEKDVFTPEEVRDILGSSFKEIKTFCQKVNVMPKKDTKTGKTFFLKNDLDLLKKIKDLNERTEEIARHNKSKQLLAQNTINKPALENEEIKKLISAVVDTRDNVVDRISKVLEEKLGGLDDVIVELIKSKTENEKLRQKIDELTKENYKLKKDVEAFKPAGLGLYIKRKILK